MAKDVSKGGRPRKFQCPLALRDTIQEYINTWLASDRPLTMAGLQCYLDVCDDTYCSYANGVYDDEIFYDEQGDQISFSGTLKKAKKFVEASKLECALSGKFNSTVSIFDLKCNHGYIETTKHDHGSSDGSMATQPNKESIEAVLKEYGLSEKVYDD